MARLALMIALLASTCLASPVPSRVYEPDYTRPTALALPPQWLGKRVAEPVAGRKGYNALPQATPAVSVEGVEAREAGRGGYNGPPIKEPPNVEPNAVVEARDPGRGGYNWVDGAPELVAPNASTGTVEARG